MKFALAHVSFIVIEESAKRSSGIQVALRSSRDTSESDPLIDSPPRFHSETPPNLLYAVAMCGRYNMTKDPRVLIEAFAIAKQLIDSSRLGPRYKIAPSQEVPIVRETPEGRVLTPIA